MTSPRESEELTQFGPGAVMRNFMREYWIPAAISSELVRDGDPIRFGCAKADTPNGSTQADLRRQGQNTL